ncbi:Centrosomal protein [Spironucleus salmonicida]|uniref:Centrosomal protein n=1 Tax=Spironucleus salmonicida TaxID=348837 RepID=V6LBY3_9EUKA|nr:Centrosomal protein [Spironucleus salmonicida]|eukprot:EST41728.1 hypothetical protein SS50377_18814 [Spironucleus salmonicida]
MNIQNFFTPDKIQEIFQTLQINPQTDPIVAEQRIQQYLITQNLSQQFLQTKALQQIQQSNQPQMHSQAISQLEFATRYDAITQQHVQTQLQFEVTGASDFNTSEEGIMSIHVRAGAGRASTKSVKAAQNPAFQSQKLIISLSQESLQISQIWQILQFSTLQICIVQRRSDGASWAFGVGEYDFSDYFERLAMGVQNEIVTMKINSIGEKDSIVGQISFRISFLGIVGDLNKDQLLTSVIQYKASIVNNEERFKQISAVYYNDFNNSIKSSRRKIFVPLHLLRDDGKMVPSVSLIQPIYSKQLNTAQKCYRFTNLFPSAVIAQHSALYKQQGIWCRPFVTLSRGTGTEEDKAVLLCSLLRGLSMPAFVAVGCTHENFAFICVLVIFDKMVQIYYQEEIFYLRFAADGTYELYDFTNSAKNLNTLKKFNIQQIDAIFNDQDIFTNFQANNAQIDITQTAETISLTGIQFFLSSASLWKRFDPELINALLLTSEHPPRVIPFDPQAAELCADSLEQKIWQLIAARRADVGLQTPRCEPLARLLGQTLPAFELEQLTGMITGTEQFKLTCKNYVENGEILLAFPLQISGPLRFHAPSVFRAIVSQEEGRKAIEAIGEDLRMGLRVFVEGYCETICSVWVIVGSVFKRYQ